VIAIPSARAGRLALTLAATATSALRAQGGGPPVYAEYRADAIVGRGTAAQGGGGVSVPFGVYVRLAVDASGGATWRDGVTRASGRVDAIGRFLLDPFREVPVALSLGGGVSVPYVEKESQVRPYLVLVVDLEGRTRGPLTPALQLGLGGGTRVGLVLRASTGRWR
jgi:hypothetical protein